MARTALVTGGNRGIGKEIARGLAASGLRTFIGARDAAEGAAAAREIGCAHVVLDVTDPEAIARAVEAMGAVDVLVNNAGVLGEGDVLDDREDFVRCLAVMVQGPYDLTRAVVPGMRARGYGRIVNVSSGWGAFAEGMGGPGGYGVAKAALNALTVATARAVPDTIKVNAMCPGWVRTRMGGPSANRSPKEGAETAIWLASLPGDGPSGGFFRRRARIEW